LASGDPFLLFILLIYALITVGILYVLIRVYRTRTRKVRKLK